MKPFTPSEVDAFHSGRQKYLRLVFSDGTIIENPDIANESMNFSQSLCDETQLTFGRCSSACFKITLLGVAQRYAGLTVDVTISAVGVDNITYTRTIGTFKVVSDTATSNKLQRNLECYDALYDILPADYAEWYNQLSFPMTLKDYRDAFFEHIGIVQETVTLVNDNMEVTKNFVANNYSGSDVIQDICEINGVFGVLNSDNHFQYITVQKPPGLYPRDDLYPADNLYPVDDSDYFYRVLTRGNYYLGSLKYEEYTCQRITQLQVRMSDNDIGAIVGTPGNTYIIQDNPLVYGKTTDELTVIGENVLGNIDRVTYVPMSVKINANLWWELGDSIRIYTDNDIINTVLLSVNLTGITALKQQWESTGQEHYTENANSVERSIVVVKQKTNELERDVEQTKSTITEVQQELDDDVTTLQTQITQNANSITTEVSRASTAEDTLSSRITQTESDITLKVSKGDVSSQLSIEEDTITIGSDRLIINSTNFKLTSTGIVTMTGANLNGGSITMIGTNSWLKLNDGEIFGGAGTTVGANQTSISFDAVIDNRTGNMILSENVFAIDANKIGVRQSRGSGTYWLGYNGDYITAISLNEEDIQLNYVDSVDVDYDYIRLDFVSDIWDNGGGSIGWSYGYADLYIPSVSASTSYQSWHNIYNISWNWRTATNGIAT